MNKERKSTSLLGPYRVLDLTDEKGLMCTKMLADLGADVIKIEPPGGDPVRKAGPFYKDIPRSEGSLQWLFFNTGKRSITLDIETTDGKRLFKELVKSADFLVECFPPGYMEQLGLGYPVLSALNPRLVMTSITPFGQNGPYSDYKGSDIVGVAMGGLMYVCGDEDRPPVRPGGEQGHCQAGIQAAMASMIAHHYREQTGEGQHVDVSMQEAVMLTMDTGQQSWDLEGTILKRVGGFRDFGDRRLPILYACKDGHVACVATARMGWDALRRWMADKGMAGDLMEDRWGPENLFAANSGEQLNQEKLDHIDAFVRPFFATFTKNDLYEQAQARRIVLCPCSTPRDLLESPQLAARRYFVEVEHPEWGASLTYPGAPYKLSEAPWRIWNRAPFIGEHNWEIYEEELGVSGAQIAELKRKKVI